MYSKSVRTNASAIGANEKRVQVEDCVEVLGQMGIFTQRSYDRVDRYRIGLKQLEASRQGTIFQLPLLPFVNLF